ncbi:hypothetical protein XELAEV_18039916mg [Xenopus laevis]|uniref:Uncharacterized protein n=1 Tax=Xenopus laevis TaxID=8355 RepID=A0A974H8K0_XENLA|nr:hypothetical protein XELAEV_18039916mg [Xenopus laevis]
MPQCLYLVVQICFPYFTGQKNDLLRSPSVGFIHLYYIIEFRVCSFCVPDHTLCISGDEVQPRSQINREL